ncbi:MAG: hypothetical protein R3191_00210 [Anaerolineales bacterium]|nr:hypothetical protein [Anaerolineales bacterium]
MLIIVASVGALVIAACGQVEPGTPPIGERLEEPAVRVTVGRSRSTPTADRAARFFAAFDPVMLRGTWAQGGGLDSPQWSPLDLHPVETMRVCFSQSGPCQPQGEWQTYELIIERTVSLTGEGRERVWIGAEFRDVEGRPVLAFVDPSAPQDLISTSLQLLPRD